MRMLLISQPVLREAIWIPMGVVSSGRLEREHCSQASPAAASQVLRCETLFHEKQKGNSILLSVYNVPSTHSLYVISLEVFRPTLCSILLCSFDR